ncbi:hypothetical protein GPJ56_006283 [Histomonas meleagridis]|uniref:uncharacterized protein n=1 Tax=Histomonas meleagridis TaxID=135588 RepID=UPI0035596C23|nr:hypothetical protein GPJ56_006283 [Histomonas meleagridis]KAH0796900.1 hypothetical protein GO595_010793 [Histomonas meleagridis]
MIAIVSFIGFLFLTAVFVFSQYRRYNLNKQIVKLLDDEENDKVVLGPEELGSKYELITQTWEKRAEINPIPEKDRLAKGWYRKGNKVFNIRDKIVRSLQKINKLAKRINPDYGIKPHQTVQQFLYDLASSKSLSMSVENVDTYLCFYSPARYGSPNIQYDDEDFMQFKNAYNILKYALMSQQRFK